MVARSLGSLDGRPVVRPARAALDVKRRRKARRKAGSQRRRSVWVGTQRSYADALRRAVRVVGGDYRGFTYNRRTGIATLT